MEDNYGLKEKVSKLPTSPGVYQYFDANGTIIYIGKAKNLKNRVSSYFVKGNNTVHVYDGTEFKAVTYPLSTTMGEEPSDTKVLTEKAVQDAIRKAVESIEVTGGEISWEPIA